MYMYNHVSYIYIGSTTEGLGVHKLLGHHNGASLSEQHTVDFIICLGTQMIHVALARGFVTVMRQLHKTIRNILCIGSPSPEVGM